MTSIRVLSYIASVADTPGSTSLLRRLFIALAMRGKFSEGSYKETTTDIVKTIASRRRLSLRNRNIGGQRLIQSVAGSGIPAVYAAQCTFVSLEDVALIKKGMTAIQRAIPGKYPLVVTAEDRSSCDHYDFEGAAAIIPMVSSAGHGAASLKRLHYQEGKFALGNILCAVFPNSEDLISARFLYEYLSTFKEELLVSKMVGTANVSLTIGKIGKIPIPIIPLEAQLKVNELMTLFSQLEASRAERERRRDRLVVASMQRLNQPTAANFRECANLYIYHFPRLTNRPEQIQQLRQAIRALAIRGRLVAQDQNDEPASTLLKRIEAERVRLIKADRIKPRAPLPRIAADQVPFQAPLGWQWVRFGELIIDSNAGWSPVCESFPRSGDNWGVLKVSAVSWGKFIASENKQLLSGIVPPESTWVKEGDFLISRANTAELVAKCVLVEEVPRKLILSDKIVRLRIAKGCNEKFLCMVNNHAEHSRSYYFEEASGTSPSMKNVSRAVIYALPIPLPPPAEQDRIVAKVEELLGLCDRLEAQLTITQAERRRLLEAVLHETLTAA